MGKINRRHHRIHHDPIVRHVAVIFDSGNRYSRFRFEGAVRAGIRSARCLAGERWPAADAFAALVIELALHRLGVTRPTWEQAQPDYQDTERFFCTVCGRALDDGRQLYCSDACNRTAQTRRMKLEMADYADAARAAFRAASNRGQLATLTCKHCAKEFTIDWKHPWSRYCSRACYQAQRRPTPRACAQCAREFTPEYRNDPRKFCSKKCEAESRRAKREPRACILCQAMFVPKRGGKGTARFCSPGCAYAARRIAPRCEAVA